MKKMSADSVWANRSKTLRSKKTHRKCQVIGVLQSLPAQIHLTSPYYIVVT